MATTIRIERVTGSELYHRYPHQTAPQPCYVALDCRTGRMWAAHSGEIGNGVPTDVFHGHVQRWSIPPLKADAANRLMDSLEALAQRVCDGYKDDWNGRNHVATFDDGHTDECDAECDREHFDTAAGALEDIERTLEQIDDEDAVSAWDANMWLAGIGSLAAQCRELGITATTTDEELSAVGDKCRAEALADDVMELDGLERHLEGLRDHAREADDAEQSALDIGT